MYHAIRLKLHTYVCTLLLYCAVIIAALLVYLYRSASYIHSSSYSIAVINIYTCLFYCLLITPGLHLYIHPGTVSSIVRSMATATHPIEQYEFNHEVSLVHYPRIGCYSLIFCTFVLYASPCFVCT
jgi:hypothetical protein